jgi:hypothetical protein
MIDCFDHDAEANSDMIIFQMSGSGMALRYGEFAAQALKGIEW